MTPQHEYNSTEGRCVTDPARIPTPIQDRLVEVYRRLRERPHASSGTEALRQLCEVLEQVEDELSGLPRQNPSPGPARFDGRMYCPEEDFVVRNSDGSLIALTRGHRIEMHADGSLRIINKLTGQTEFER